jgi:4-amino-4-deoxy-L-arabinose transferase-like glycosyltransferase
MLALLCLAVYLPGLWTIPPVDRDECRFAQASRQMFEAAAWPETRLDLRRDDLGRPLGAHAGGWVVPMVQSTPRLNKPPLIYWLQVGSAWLFTAGDPARDAMWMYRVPSVLAAIVTVLATWWLGRMIYDPRVATLGAALLAVAPMVVWDAHQARSDQLLLACTTLAMLALAGCLKHAGVIGSAPASRVLTRQSPGRWLWPITLWAAVGLGVLAKGFITPMVVLLAIAAIAFWLRSLAPVRAVRPILALPVVGVVVLPWVWLIGSTFGLGWYAQTVWQETFLRAATGSHEGHFAPPGTHLVLLVALFWPGCLLTSVAFFGACRRAWGVGAMRHTGGLWATLRDGVVGAIKAPARGRVIEVWLLAWIVPSWLVFEASLAKLPHYTMPLYPAIALLTARWVFRLAATGRTAEARGARISGRDPGLIVWMLVPLGLAIGLVVAGLLTDRGVWMPYGPALAGAALALSLGLPLILLAWMALRRGRLVFGHGVAIAASVWMLGVGLQLVVPSAVPGSRSERVMHLVRWAEGAQPASEPTGASERAIYSTYREDSMVFQTRGRMIRVSAEDLPKRLAADPRAIGVVNLDEPLEPLLTWLNTLPPSTARAMVPDGRARLAVVLPEDFVDPAPPLPPPPAALPQARVP